MYISSLGLSQTFTVEPISEKEGLTYNNQWASSVLLEDPFGFIWIGTLNGLNRYDGYGITQYLSSHEHENLRIPNQGITALTQDNQDNIWIGTMGDGIFMYNALLEKFETPILRTAEGDTINLGQINALYFDGQELNISGVFKGNWKYNLEEKVIREITLSEEKEKEEPLHIFDYKKAPDGKTIMLTRLGIFVEELDGETFTHMPIPASYGPGYFDVTQEGNIIVSSYEAIKSLIIDYKSGEIRQLFPDLDSKNEVVFADPKGGIWVNDRDQKLFYSERRTDVDTFVDQKTINLDTSFSYRILDMMPNSHGDIFFMSYKNGAGKITTHTKAFSPVFEKKFTDILAHGDKLYSWKSDSLFVFENNEQKYVPLENELEDHFIAYLFIDKSDNFWVIYHKHLSHSYLSKFDSKGKLIFNHYNRLSLDMLPSNTDTILINNLKYQGIGGDYTYIGDYIKKLSDKPFNDMFLFDMIKSKSDEYWMATDKDGVYVMNKDLTEVRKVPQLEIDSTGLLNSEIKFMFESMEELIFFYSDNGITIWNPADQSYSYILSNNGIPISKVRGITQDRLGLIWIIGADNIYSYQLETEEVLSFSIPDNFKPKEIFGKEFYVNIQKTASGKIYYNGVNGTVELRPDELVKQNPPNDPIITDLYVDRKKIFPHDQTEILDSSILYQSSFEVKYNQRNIGFSFVSYEGERYNTSYSYRLTGVQDEWTPVEGERTIHFTNLEPKNYNFEVRVKSGAGKQSENIAAVKFSVKPPWYETIVAYIIYLILFLGLIYLFLKTRINRAVKELKAIEDIRTKISSDLHDDVGTILAGVALQSELLSMNATDQNRDELIELSGDTRDAMDKMRDIVWALDSRKDKFENLYDKMSHFAETMLNKSGFKLEMYMNDIAGSNKIQPDYRQNLYLIFKEAIGNIIKHSNGDRVVVKIEKTGNHSKLSIWDNGTANVIAKSEGLGLSNMKMRAEKIGAQFKINNEDGFEIAVLF